ncbi:MAG: asparagine synthetase B family protein [Sphingomicrobium sp.]
MTAIFGLWRFDGEDATPDAHRMSEALARYGNDDCQLESPIPSFALGRRLHRSLPEDRFSTPIDSGGRYRVAADVRLTERDDLLSRLGLQLEGAEMSDAAIAAKAIEAWHEQAFDRIYGSFAIAAWDSREQRLLLARDPLGQKPLFFHSGREFFAFASMPVGLHALAAIPRAPDVETVKRFLALELPAPGKSHYEGIGRIMPGHYAIVSDHGFAETRYWNPNLDPLRLPSNDDYARALGEHIDRAVAAALRGAETQVGAHLSSGFDSTTVATSAARQLADRGGKVVAYTAAPRQGRSQTFRHRGGDESVLAGATARMHPNMEHVVVRSSRTPMANLDRTASIYGMPVFNICNQSWYDAINDDAAARGIGVMLEGSMGNSTISETGFLALPELMRTGRLLAWAKLSASLHRNGALGLPALLWRSFRPWVPNGLYRWLVERRYGPLVSPERFSPLRKPHLDAAMADASKEGGASLSGERPDPASAFRSRDDSLADRLAGLAADDTGVQWKGRLGEWKIDYRDPTADRRLVEFSLRIPVEQLICDGRPRALLRKVLADRAPQEVLDNPTRGYQFADWHELLAEARPEIAEEIGKIEGFGPSAEILDIERLKALLENWPDPGSEEWTGYAATIDYRCCLLRAISAGSFMRHAAGAAH